MQNSKHQSNNWNITWEQGVFISNLIKIKQPKNILEIGTSNGYSTLWIAKELNTESKITTIEINQKRADEAKINFKFCKLNNIS